MRHFPPAFLLTVSVALSACPDIVAPCTADICGDDSVAIDVPGETDALSDAAETDADADADADDSKDDAADATDATDAADAADAAETKDDTADAVDAVDAAETQDDVTDAADTKDDGADAADGEVDALWDVTSEVDGTSEVDAAPDVDVGPLCSTAPGAFGSVCTQDGTCDGEVTCLAEFSSTPNGVPATLGSLFGIFEGTPDPGNSGEFIPGPPSSIAIVFAPDGQCSNPCEPVGPDTCGDCASCSSRIGGPTAFETVGLRPNVYTGDPSQGICRQDCVFDASGATNGGCPSGYTCDARDNVCVEACSSDEQCNLQWGQSREKGLVAAVAGNAVCSLTSGRCIWPTPGTAELGSPCASEQDCFGSVGNCFFGVCTHFQCAPGPDGAAPAYPCDGGVCLGATGEDSSVCLPACTFDQDCPSGFGCVQQLYCSPVCEGNDDCPSGYRCREDQETGGLCEAFCDPAGILPGGEGIICEADEACVPAKDEDYGFCQRLNQLCTADSECVGGQACEVLNNDFQGRCVDGCSAGGCDVGVCVVQPNSEVGVCRVAGGSCGGGPAGPDSPLHGDAQCPPGEICNAVDPGSLGGCVAF